MIVSIAICRWYRDTLRKDYLYGCMLHVTTIAFLSHYKGGKDAYIVPVYVYYDVNRECLLCVWNLYHWFVVSSSDRVSAKMDICGKRSKRAIRTLKSNLKKKRNGMNNSKVEPRVLQFNFSDSILCSSALVKRVKQLQIPDEDSAGGDYYQLTYPN